MGFATFMASATGRWLRVIAGLVLVAIGLTLAFQAGNMAAGIVIAVVGMLPFLAGIFDVCIFAPLFGAPFSGPRIRAAAR